MLAAVHVRLKQFSKHLFHVGQAYCCNSVFPRRLSRLYDHVVINLNILSALVVGTMKSIAIYLCQPQLPDIYIFALSSARVHPYRNRSNSSYQTRTTYLLTKAPFDRFGQPLRRCTRQTVLGENHHGVETMRDTMPVKDSTYSYAAIIPLFLSDVQVLCVIIFLIGRLNFASQNKSVVEENIFNIETDPELTLSRSLSLGRLSKQTCSILELIQIKRCIGYCPQNGAYDQHPYCFISNVKAARRVRDVVSAVKRRSTGELNNARNGLTPLHFAIFQQRCICHKIDRLSYLTTIGAATWNGQPQQSSSRIRVALVQILTGTISSTPYFFLKMCGSTSTDICWSRRGCVPGIYLVNPLSRTQCL